MRRRREEGPHWLRLLGVWVARCEDAGGRPLWGETLANDVTTEGLTDLLGVAFAAGTQKAAWYAGLIDGSGAGPALAAADTLSGHAGWTEVTSYSGSRKQWAPAAAGGLAANATPMSFTFTAAATLGGLFLCSAASGASGVLWSTAAFAAPRAVAAGQLFRLFYRLRAGAGGTRP